MKAASDKALNAIKSIIDRFLAVIVMKTIFGGKRK